MASSGYAPWSVVADEQPTAAKWNILGSNDASFNNGNGLEDAVIVARHLGAGVVSGEKIDWASLQNNIKSQQNTSALSVGNGTFNMGTQGCQISFDVPVACKALVSVFVGTGATADHEYSVGIMRGGVAIKSFSPNAAYGINSRANVRGYTTTLDLVAGTNLLSLYVSFANGSSHTVAIGGAHIAALVMGRVTA